MLKRNTAIFVIAVFFIAACTIEPPPPLRVFSFAQVMKDAKAYSSKRAIFNNGVIVFKEKKERTSVVVVTEYPFPNVKSKNDLADNQVMAIKLSQNDYQKLQVGTIISVTGYIKTAKKKGKLIYYVNAQQVTSCGQVNIEDPDFHKLVDIINQKSKDEYFFNTLIILTTVNMMLLNN
jgi:hypothetical protein